MVNLFRMLKELLSIDYFLQFRYILYLYKHIITFSIKYKKVYNSFKTHFNPFLNILETNHRVYIIYLYLYNSLNCVFKSCKLLLKGFTLEAHHNDRHFIESISISILCSRRSIGIYEQLLNNKDKFPYHKALYFLRKPKNIKILNLQKTGTNTLDEINKFANKISHASFTSLGHIHNFSKQNVITIGPIFDSKKKNVYKNHMKKLISVCNILEDIYNLIFSNLHIDNLI